MSTHETTVLFVFSLAHVRTSKQTTQLFLLSIHVHMYMHVNTLDNTSCCRDNTSRLVIYSLAHWLIIAFISWNSNSAPLLEGLSQIHLDLTSRFLFEFLPATLLVVKTTVLALRVLNAVIHVHTYQHTTVFVLVHVNTRDNSLCCHFTGTCTYTQTH